MIERTPPPPPALLEGMLTKEERRRGREFLRARQQARARIAWEPMWESWMHEADRPPRPATSERRIPVVVEFRNRRGERVAITIRLPAQAA